MAYQAKIIADSLSETGCRLTTMEVTFPRMVLAEFNTHRMFSRNSASSRAIPVEKQLAKVMEDPFIPVHFGVNQPGMQAPIELDDAERTLAKEEWLRARNSAVSHVRHLLSLEVHKQITNRILEPFMWHTVIVTATEWSNFFALRAHPDAQPEIRVIAEMMEDIYEKSSPLYLDRYDWHLPFIQEDERDGKFEFTRKARCISAARCARVSYLTHDGVRDHEADLALYERLVSGGHMSPLEHVAITEGDDFSEWTGNFRGWKQFRKLIPNEGDFALIRAGKNANVSTV